MIPSLDESFLEVACPFNVQLKRLVASRLFCMPCLQACFMRRLNEALVLDGVEHLRAGHIQSRPLLAPASRSW